MSREIKFRAWDDELKQMFYSKTEQFDDSLLFRFQHFDSEEPIYMQFTGLRDKNGKEIYDGDILLFNNDYPNAQKADWKCVVKYRKGSFVCEYPKDGVYNHFDSWNVPKVTWEVIGNIYENPELLEVQHELPYL